MKKRVFSAFLVLIAVILLFAGCEEKKEPQGNPITMNEAIQIVLEKADISPESANPHVHAGKYKSQECYLVYISDGGKNMVYSVDCFTGEILNIEQSSHSH